MKKGLIYLLFLLACNTVGGQEILIKTEYPRVVTSGETFTVMWTINSGEGQFTAPQFTGLYKLMGPSTSYSSNTQIVNGKYTQEISYSYVFYLQAMEAGKFVIPPAVIKVKNKEYRSDSLYIEVIKNNSQKQQGQANQNNTAGQGDQSAGNDIFLRLVLNRSEAYLGEAIVASLKLYTRVDLGGLNEIKFPSFNGFLKENLETAPLTSLLRENVNGTIYGTGVVQQFLLFPQVTGEIKIDPVELTVLIQQKTGQTDPFFGDFFGNYQNVPKVIVSQPVKINVKSYPGTKPADFSGVVGKIDLNATLNKDTVNVNDALNFRITISGSGNLKIAGTPLLKLSPDIEVYDPKISDNIKNTAAGSNGQKIFEFVLIPRHYGDFTIPAITYSYFNSASKQYERLSTKEFHFYARKTADQGGQTTVYGGVSKEEVKYLGKDIRFLKTDTKGLKINDKAIISQRSFLTIYGFALFIFLVVLFIRREHVRRNSDISLVRNRKAAKVAGKRLNEASKCLKSGTTDKFHEEILKALWGYLSDKLNIPVSELTRNTAVDTLRERGVGEEIIENLVSILDKCEFARFAPSSSSSELSDIYEGAAGFISSVENKIG